MKPMAHSALHHPDLGLAVHHFYDALHEQNTEKPSNVRGFFECPGILRRLGPDLLKVSRIQRRFSLEWFPAREDEPHNRSGFVNEVPTAFGLKASCIFERRQRTCFEAATHLADGVAPKLL